MLLVVTAVNACAEEANDRNEEGQVENTTMAPTPTRTPTPTPTPTPVSYTHLTLPTI